MDRQTILKGGNIMKKIYIILAAALLAAGAMTGCADKNSSSSSLADSSSQEVHEPEFEPDQTELHQPETPLPDLTNVKSEYESCKADITERNEDISSKKTEPCINITTEGGEEVLSKDQYLAAVIDVFNCDAQYELSAEGGVKVRGNSSADQGDEKPYRIKFAEKHNMLGLHNGNEYKSWVLLRSYWNLGTDYTALNLAKAIFDGKYYCTDCKYVNLYINGDYKGIYVLCEQNQAAKDRVSVNEPDAENTDYKIGYLLEIDNYPGDDHPYFSYDYEQAEVEDISGEKRQFVSAEYTLKSDLNVKGQLDFAEKYTTGAFKILYEACINDKAMKFDSTYEVVDADDMSPQEAVEAVIDTESLANMLILEELVHNYDVGEGSFYMAFDMSEDSIYPKLTFLAPWDFNWSYEGSPSGGYYAATFQPEVGSQDRSNPWFITAMKADWFKETVKEKWAALKESDALKNACKKVLDDVSVLKDDLGEDEWKIDKVYEIINFVYGRIDFLDGEWS